MHRNLLIVIGLLWWNASPVTAETVGSNRRGMVATIQPIATRAGLDALRSGGNAIDAAIASALTLGVVDSHNSGIGGGCFMLIRLADGRLFALDGRETAPARATRDMFLRNGKADPKLSQDGALAVGVPGELAVLAQASRRFGRMPMRSLLEAAARVAEMGFPIDRHYAHRLKDTHRQLAASPEARAIFLNADGQPFAAGDVLRQRDLAASYRAIATNGVEWFYQGAFAKRTADWMRSHGGLLNEQDFSGYQVVDREPVRGSYRGFDLVSFPPPSSGGLHVVQILNILEPYDVNSLGDRSADFVHLVSEAMKLAFADRATWLGDPDFTPVPRGLVSKAYARDLSRRIRMDRATPVTAAGTPPAADTDVFRKEANRHTTHFATADAEGNWVACTASLNTSFGSKVVIPGTGILLNNHMDDFAAQPGVPNYFGLVGAEANAVSPGKRPLSSMSPTFVLKEGKPILSIGAAGGPTIITQTVLAILRTLDFGADPGSALLGGRFHHQWKPDELRIESRFDTAVIEELRRRGHRVVVEPSIGAAQAIGIGRVDGFVGAADPRSEGQAEGF